MTAPKPKTAAQEIMGYVQQALIALTFAGVAWIVSVTVELKTANEVKTQQIITLTNKINDTQNENAIIMVKVDALHEKLYKFEMRKN